MGKYTPMKGLFSSLKIFETSLARILPASIHFSKELARFAGPGRSYLKLLSAQPETPSITVIRSPLWRIGKLAFT